MRLLHLAYSLSKGVLAVDLHDVQNQHYLAPQEITICLVEREVLVSAKSLMCVPLRLDELGEIGLPIGLLDKNTSQKWLVEAHF